MLWRFGKVLRCFLMRRRAIAAINRYARRLNVEMTDALSAQADVNGG